MTTELTKEQSRRWPWRGFVIGATVALVLLLFTTVFTNAFDHATAKPSVRERIAQTCGGKPEDYHGAGTYTDPVTGDRYVQWYRSDHRAEAVWVFETSGAISCAVPMCPSEELLRTLPSRPPGC